MIHPRAIFRVSLLLVILLASRASAAPPERPPSFRGPEGPAAPPEPALPGQAPGAWCPAGEDFLRWIEGRRILAGPPELRRRPGSPRAPVVQLLNGVVVMEDDGTLLRNDRQPDLSGLTLEFRPSPAGWDIDVLPLAYETDIGIPVLVDQRGWAEAPVDLTLFAFPFGGSDRSRVWVTSTAVLAFEDPAAPGPSQLQFRDVLLDRLPRVAPLQQGTNLLGWNAWFREAPDRAIFTWRAPDAGGGSLDAQAVLMSDGRVLFHYQSLAGVLHGAPAVVDADPAWWSDRRAGGSGTDPAGDVPIPDPDGSAIDITEVRGFQVSGTELLQLEVVLSAPPPAATDATLQFAVELRDEPGGAVLATLWAEWEDGHWNWTNTPVEIEGNILRFPVLRPDLPLLDDDVEALAWSAQAWNWQEAVAGMLSWPVTPPAAIPLDLSAGPYRNRKGPLFEPFTLPELLPYSVWEAFRQAFGDRRIDGLAIFQNFLTDLVLYAGAYSTVGNAGADGIGAGSSAQPESPALLHMNALRYGWNSWDEGKLTVLNHEFGHRWLYFFSILENGTPGKPLGDGHPAGWVHTPAAYAVLRPDDASCMGGSNWRDNGDGTFTDPPAFVSHGYSDHELYLMGLAAPGEVTDWFYLRDSNPSLPGAYWPPENLTVTATRADVTFGQLEGAMGPRNPACGWSRSWFVVPMVLVVRPGGLQAGEVDEVVRTCNVWAPAFETATGGRGHVTCLGIGSAPPTVTITDPPADVSILAGDSVTFSGTGQDPDGDPVELSWDFGSAAPGASGGGPHAIVFPGAGTWTVFLKGRDSTGMEAASPETRVVTVGCRTPSEVQGLRVERPGDGTLRLNWIREVPGPDEFLALSCGTPQGGFTEVATGPPVLSMPEPPGTVFFKVAARNLPDCLGPY